MLLLLLYGCLVFIAVVVSTLFPFCRVMPARLNCRHTHTEAVAVAVADTDTMLQLQTHTHTNASYTITPTIRYCVIAHVDLSRLSDFKRR